MGRSTVHYADNKTNNTLKALHNKLRPAGTPVQRVEYIIELLLLRIFETKLKRDDEFKSLRKLFDGKYKWKNPKTNQEETNENRLFSHLSSVSNDQILPELNNNFFPFYAALLQTARQIFEGNLKQKVQDQLVLIEEVFSNSNFTNNVNSGNLGEVISLCSEIDEDRLLKTDLLGDAIESALSETGGTKDIGLHRTPDHIRQFMTALVEPNFDDSIFDPACGTGGFLFDAFEFVMQRVEPNGSWLGDKAHSELKKWFEEYFKKNPLEMPNSSKSRQFYRTGVSGIEYLGMIRKMAAINFYIRGLNPANIDQGDSLAKFNPATDAESKSIVLANPPFGAERDQESYPDVWNEFSKESETTILFVKLMFETLRASGRCAVIVSEGFHTWDQFSAKALRRKLLDETNLRAVISLPQGLFVSKNGVGPKTSILLFEKGGKTDWVWFYKVTNDGYTMGTNRKEQSGCQLVECLTLYHEYVKLGKKPPESKHQFCIPSEWIKILDPRIKEKIRTETRSDMEAKGAEERKKKSEELDKKIEAGKISKGEKSMELKMFDQNLENRIANEIAKRIEKAHNYSFNLANYKSTLNATQLKEWKDALKKINPNGVTTLEEAYKKLQSGTPDNAPSYIAKLNPTNALEADIVREYVSNLKEKEIAKHKELNELKTLLKSGAKYPIVKLKDYLVLNENKVKPKNHPTTNYTVLGVSNETGIFINEYLNPEETNQSYFLVEKNQFCYNPYRINVGSIGLNEFNYPNQIISGAYIVFGCKEDELSPKYLEALLKSKPFLSYVNDKANGGVRMNFQFEDICNWEIPLPSTVEEQTEIINQVSSQKGIIEGANKIFENWEINSEQFQNQFEIKKEPISNLILESLYGTSEKADYSKDGHKVLRIGNIGLCSFKLDDVKKVSLTKKEFEKYKLKNGDFLIVRSNGNPALVGKCAVWDSDEEYVYASYLIRFRFDIKKVEPKFVMYFLMSKEGRRLLKPEAGGGTYNISATELQKVLIPLPNPTKQREVVAELDSQMIGLLSLQRIKTVAEKKLERILSEVWGVEISEPITEEVA